MVPVNSGREPAVRACPTRKDNMLAKKKKEIKPRPTTGGGLQDEKKKCRNT